jgi:hypothetical protein
MSRCGTGDVSAAWRAVSLIVPMLADEAHPRRSKTIQIDATDTGPWW